MAFRPKLWLSVGVVALAGTTGAYPNDVERYSSNPDANPDIRNPSASSSSLTFNPIMLAQMQGYGGESGERGEAGERKRSLTVQDGEGGEGGERSRKHRKPPIAEREPLPRNGSGGEAGERGIEHRSSLPTGEGGERGTSPLRGHGGEGGEAGVNTRYIFGFTEGADTEPQGEKEFESDTIGKFGKRAGSYAALQNKTELEFGLTDRLMAEFGAFTSYHHIHNVPNLDDRNSGKFDGLSAELKYRLLDRSIHPFGLAISVEPEWRRSSGTSGSPENSYELELKASLDKELIPDRLYWAANMTYEPEIVRVNEPGIGSITERESSFNVETAVSAAIAPNVFLGAELRYLSAYEGLGLEKFEGYAFYFGPSLSAKVSPHTIIQIAYSHQIAGKSVDEPHQNLDLDNFDKQQVRLRFVAEF